ncbi:MAG TPA: tripartite tricarboxylate transporter substrate-binding protein, partial [Burkholderiales bacterium]
MSAAAQDWPAKPLRIIVPFTPGGVADNSARVVAEPLGARLGQQVIAENRPGAGGNVGTHAAAQAESDGYTLLLGYDGTLVINPHVYAKIPFDTLRDFAAVTKLGDATLILVAHPSAGVKTLGELIAQAKSKPFSYGTSGTGNTTHLVAELLKQRTGTRLEHVPYKGGGQAVI